MVCCCPPFTNCHLATCLCRLKDAASHGFFFFSHNDHVLKQLMPNSIPLLPIFRSSLSIFIVRLHFHPYSRFELGCHVGQLLTPDFQLKKTQHTGCFPDIIQLACYGRGGRELVQHASLPISLLLVHLMEQRNLEYDEILHVRHTCFYQLRRDCSVYYDFRLHTDDNMSCVE
jgi:hypothetical protein